MVVNSHLSYIYIGKRVGKKMSRAMMKDVFALTLWAVQE
jgi:hypothetical protein